MALPYVESASGALNELFEQVSLKDFPRPTLDRVLVLPDTMTIVEAMMLFSEKGIHGWSSSTAVYLGYARFEAHICVYLPSTLCCQLALSKTHRLLQTSPSPSSMWEY